MLNVRSQIIHGHSVPMVKLLSFLLLLHGRGMWHICFLNTYFVTRFDFDFQVTDAGIGHLAKHCQKLKKLDLQGCNVSCDKYMYTTQSNHGSTCSIEPVAVYLHCFLCLQSITDEALHRVGQHCNQLLFICISNCARLTDASLVSLGQGCPNIR